MQDNLSDRHLREQRRDRFTLRRPTLLVVFALALAVRTVVACSSEDSTTLFAGDVGVDAADISIDTSGPSGLVSDSASGDEDSARQEEDAPGGGKDVVTSTSAPRIATEPVALDFGTVRVGSEAVLQVAVRNTGATDLSVDRVMLAGDLGFSVEANDAPLIVDGSDGRYRLDPTLVVRPSQSTLFQITFTPTSDRPVTGRLRIHSNDPRSEWTDVALTAGPSGARVQARPDHLSFGANTVGRIAKLPLVLRSTGIEDLVITKISFEPTHDPGFSVDLLGVGGEPSDERPKTIPAGEERSIRVLYVPSAVNATDPGTGEPIVDRATLTIESNARETTLSVQVDGWGVAE